MADRTAGDGGFFRRERRSRRFAAILIAPAAVVPFVLAGRWGYATVSGHHEKFIEELRFLTSMSYIGSGLSAGLLGFVMRRKTWSPAGQTIMWLFPACCAAVTGVLFLLLILLAWFASLSTNFGPGPLVPSGPVLALGAAVFSLPVALAYCLIAGVPWRAKAAD